MSETDSQSGKASGRVKVVAWTAGVTGVCAIAMIDDSPSWPAAFVAGCVVAMVGFVCYLILNR